MMEGAEDVSQGAQEVLIDEIAKPVKSVATGGGVLRAYLEEFASIGQRFVPSLMSKEAGVH